MADPLADAAESSSSAAYAAGATAGATAATTASSSSETSGDDNDNDENLARRLQVLDQLTTVFGFTMEMAEEAVDAVGFHDINLCYNYILDNLPEAKDSGGPITPIDSCPHIQNHVKLSLEQLQSIQPHATTCQHVTKAKPATGATSSAAVGRFKSELQDDGNCPGTENWLCLECGLIGCSRYVNGHGLVHWKQTKKVAAEEAAATSASSNNDADNVVDTNGHCVAVSLEDLSVWCYVCNAYLRHPSLSAITQKLEELKFDDTLTIACRTGATTAAATAAAVKEPERKKARQQQNDDREIGRNDDDDDDHDDDDDDDGNDDDDDDDDDRSGRSPARGMELNLDITGEEDESELFRMISAAAAAQGIPLQSILASLQGQSYDEDDENDDENIEYPFEQLPKSLTELGDFIKSDKCRNILILAGAGMSVAAGIPDFRSADGLYATMNANAITCTNPEQREAIRQDPSTALDQHLFLENPLPCLESQREFILGTRAQRWKATLAHRFVELLHNKTGKLVRLYTQNIDGLEDQCTPLPQDKVIAVHGSMDRAECARCASRMDFGQFCNLVQEQIKDLTGQDTNAPTESTPITCPTCGYNSVKPAIVLFRSNLPKQFFESVPNDVKDIDLLFIFGTSLKVAPANSLVWRVPKSAMRVLVNREIVGEHLGLNFYEDQYAAADDDDIHDTTSDNVNGTSDKVSQQAVAASGAAGAAAFALTRRTQRQQDRDYFAEGDCDEVLLDLMIALGWLDDLKPLLSNHALPASSQALLSQRLEQEESSHKQEDRAKRLDDDSNMKISS